MKRIILMFAFVCLAVPALAQSKLNNNPDAIVGDYWVTDPKEGNSTVKFYKVSDGKYNCQVTWIERNIDPRTNKPRLDYKNPDKSLRGRRCDSLVIIYHLKYNSEKKRWEGRIYDPSRGITANFTGEFTEKGELKMRGSILGIGETRYWSKLKK